MEAEIISVGHELLMGELVDTNTAFLASHLPEVGVRVRRTTLVGDDVADVAEAVQRALGSVPVVLTVGGLGPTADDVTREAVARVAGETPVVDEDRAEALRAWFRGRGFAEMPRSNLRQALHIPSGSWLPNRVGTAAGWWVEREGRVVATLPGPPRELEVMWEEQVKPRLASRSSGPVILTRTLKSFGLTEAEVDERVADIPAVQGRYLGVYAKPDGIHVRVIVERDTGEAAAATLEQSEAEVWERLAGLIWGVDEETPQEQLGRCLRERGLTLAVMESCTGGLVAHLITEVPGSSGYFRGGAVAYSPEAKVAWGVDPEVLRQHGVVSGETAAAMAAAAREAFKADAGIGVTGVAGPDPLDGAEPGTVYVGLSHPGGKCTLERRYPPRRHQVKGRAAVAALLGLWQQVRDG